MVWTATPIRCPIQSFIVIQSYASINRAHVPVEHASVIKDLHFTQLNCIHILTMIIMDLHLIGPLNVSNTKVMALIFKMIVNGEFK